MGFIDFFTGTSSQRSKYGLNIEKVDRLYNNEESNGDARISFLYRTIIDYHYRNLCGMFNNCIYMNQSVQQKIQDYDSNMMKSNGVTLYQAYCSIVSNYLKYDRVGYLISRDKKIYISKTSSIEFDKDNDIYYIVNNAGDVHEKRDIIVICNNMYDNIYKYGHSYPYFYKQIKHKGNELDDVIDQLTSMSDTILNKSNTTYISTNILDSSIFKQIMSSGKDRLNIISNNELLDIINTVANKMAEVSSSTKTAMDKKGKGYVTSALPITIESAIDNKHIEMYGELRKNKINILHRLSATLYVPPTLITNTEGNAAQSPSTVETYKDISSNFYRSVLNKIIPYFTTHIIPSIIEIGKNDKLEIIDNFYYNNMDKVKYNASLLNLLINNAITIEYFIKETGISISNDDIIKLSTLRENNNNTENKRTERTNNLNNNIIDNGGGK